MGGFTVTRPGDPAAPITVKIDSSAGTAVLGALGDYETSPDISGGAVTIPADWDSVEIIVTPVDDSLQEGPETVILAIVAGTGYEVGAQDKATVTIADDDLPPAAFDLLLPVDGSIDLSRTPTLEWEVSENATSYALTVADNAGFASPLIDQAVTSNSHAVGAGILRDGTGYWWKVTAHNTMSPPPGGQDAANNPFTFTTEADVTSPTVLTHEPGDGETGVGVAGGIVVTFSEPMDAAATEAAFSVTAGGSPVGGTIAWSAGGDVLTFTPSGSLDSDTAYAVTITTGAVDLAATPNPLPEECTFAFATEDVTAPTAVTEVSLAPGDEQIVLAWRNPFDGDYAGVLVLRRVGDEPTGAPTDGTTYSAGNALGDGFVVYVGTGSDSIPGDRSTWTDDGLMNGETYHYAIFAFDGVGNYSTGMTGTAEAGETPSEDGGCLAAGSGSPPAWLLPLALLVLFLGRPRFHESASRLHDTRHSPPSTPSTPRRM